MKSKKNSEPILPRQLYSAAQIREIERVAIEEKGIPAFELMLRAGQAVYANLLNQHRKINKVSVYCGSGNNAGDGYVVARLALLAGYDVTVFCLADPVNLKGPALQAYLSYAEVGGRVTAFSNNFSDPTDIIIDAMLGTGLLREVSGAFLQAIDAINNNNAYKIAVDIPSGLHADTGNVLGCAVNADATITFIGLKQGLFTGQASEYSGEISYASLDIPTIIFDRIDSSILRVQYQRLPKRHRCSHKGTYGHVLIIGGELGYSGAARLAGEAALRVGAGLVSLATRKEHAGFINTARPELMCHGIETAQDLANLIAKATVIVLGPGLGQNEWSEMLFNEAVKTEKPLIIDADGLNWLAKTPQHKSNWILTPHPGEAARLLATSTQIIQADRYSAVRTIQRNYGGIAILKGAGSLIASDAGIAVSTSGNPGMASGGMGDVLAGVIGGLWAQGFSQIDAAQQGVFLHGLAADSAAEAFGERGLLASDLFPYLQRLVN